MGSLDVSGCLHIVGVWDQVRETWSGQWKGGSGEEERAIEDCQTGHGRSAETSPTPIPPASTQTVTSSRKPPNLS